MRVSQQCKNNSFCGETWIIYNMFPLSTDCQHVHYVNTLAVKKVVLYYQILHFAIGQTMSYYMASAQKQIFGIVCLF